MAFQEDIDGNLHPVIATWLPRFSLECSDYDTGLDEDYDEKNEIYYWPEGWYENVQNWDDLKFVKMPDPFFWQEITYPQSTKDNIEKAFEDFFNHVETLIEKQCV